jgi:Tetratricopeptide repeat
MELAAKQLQTAIELASQAYERSYGDNQLRVTLLLAQAYAAHGEIEKSKQIIDTTLKKVEVPQDPKVRSNRYLAELRKLRETLN